MSKRAIIEKMVPEFKAAFADLYDLVHHNEYRLMEFEFDTAVGQIADLKSVAHDITTSIDATADEKKDIEIGVGLLLGLEQTLYMERLYIFNLN